MREAFLPRQSKKEKGLCSYVLCTWFPCPNLATQLGHLENPALRFVSQPRRHPRGGLPPSLYVQLPRPGLWLNSYSLLSWRLASISGRVEALPMVMRDQGKEGNF